MSKTVRLSSAGGKMSGEGDGRKCRRLAEHCAWTEGVSEVLLMQSGPREIRIGRWFGPKRGMWERLDLCMGVRSSPRLFSPLRLSPSLSINSVRSPLPTNSDKLSPATPLNVHSDDEQSIVCDVEHS